MKVDKKKAESLLRKVVRETGADHVTDRCVYRDAKGSPVCMVGKVVAELTDLPLNKVFPGGHIMGFSATTNQQKKVHRWDAGDNGEPFDSVVEAVVERTGIEFTPGAIDLLRSAQEEQDAFKPWGQVVQIVTRSR